MWVRRRRPAEDYDFVGVRVWSSGQAGERIKRPARMLSECHIEGFDECIL
jgi:hypothetical protein